jgi:hypothetical protein
MNSAESLSFRLLVSTGNKKVGWYWYVQSALLDSFTSTSKTSTLLPLTQFPANFHGNNNVDRHILASRCRWSSSLVSASYPFWNVAVHRGLESTSWPRYEYPIGSANFGPSAKRDPSTRSPGKGEGATSDHQPRNGDVTLTPWIPATDRMGFRYRTNCNVG